jgi:hypothetical protein
VRQGIIRGFYVRGVSVRGRVCARGVRASRGVRADADASGGIMDMDGYGYNTPAMCVLCAGWTGTKNETTGSLLPSLLNLHPMQHNSLRSIPIPLAPALPPPPPTFATLTFTATGASSACGCGPGAAAPTSAPRREIFFLEATSCSVRRSFSFCRNATLVCSETSHAFLRWRHLSAAARRRRTCRGKSFQ